MESDVALMAELGLQSYRTSVAWGRILPEGRGAVNEQGLDFYKRLVDTLLRFGIQPMLTLYHWDLPAALEDRGGWLNPDIAAWFTEYTAVMVDALDDRVPLWATLNEPWVIAHMGYWVGEMAPGHRNLYELPRVSHNLMRANASALRHYQSVGKQQMGLVVNLEAKHAASMATEDVAAAKREDAEFNRQYLDAVFFGQYPEELPVLFGDAWPAWTPDDLAEVHVQPDFLGINYYTRQVVAANPDAPFTRSKVVRQTRSTYTHMDWEVYADGLRERLVWVAERYGDIPLYVTENGAAFYDPPQANGRVSDPQRVAYLKAHILAAHAAIAEGVDLRGYYLWSMFDNFEWAYGYDRRFGITHVDYETLERTFKDSAYFYQRVIASNGAALAD